MGRLPLPFGRRKYQIQKLWPLQKEISRRQLLGQKSVEIARDLNISTATICNSANGILGSVRREELELARDADCVQVARQIRELAPLALQVVRELMENENGLVQPVVRLSAAKDTLDRAGFAAPTKVNIQSQHLFLTASDLAEIKQRARDAGVCVSSDRRELGIGESENGLEALEVLAEPV